MPRYFTHAQATGLLPQVEEEIRRAISIKQQHQQSESQLREFTHRVAAMGGMFIERERFLAQRSRRDAMAMRLKELIEEIHALGCQVKDLDTGLIDFPTIFRGEEVLLCWRLGEPGIEYWHGTHEGFRGRKLIDEEFLANHHGDLTE